MDSCFWENVIGTGNRSLTKEGLMASDYTKTIELENGTVFHSWVIGLSHFSLGDDQEEESTEVQTTSLN